MSPDNSGNGIESDNSPEEIESGEIRNWVPLIVIAGVVLLILVAIVLIGRRPASPVVSTEEPSAIEMTETATETPSVEPTEMSTEEATEMSTEAPATPIEINYSFEEDDEGWFTGFADLPVDYDEEIYELEAGWRELPSGLEGYGIYMQGHNRSDDLFMFLKKQVDGLNPNTTYQAIFTIDLATNIPEGLMGIGGSPGESVFVKAGATVVEPEVIEDTDGWLRMNIDKGNQASEGEDMINLGNIANPNLDPDTATGDEFAIKTLHNLDRPFEVTTDEDGVLWFIAGTDSGFEGPTTVYYDVINVVLSEVSSQ